MNARQTKKLMTTSIDRLSPMWLKALRGGKDGRINKALRMWNKKKL